MCLKDMVYFAQAKWTVRVSAQQGNWYGALMGMSNVFKQMNAVKKNCQLVQKGYRHRMMATQYTCQDAALYMESNAVGMAMAGKRSNGEKFFYYAAQTYAGALGMSQKCRNMKEAFNAFTRAEVLLAKKLIQRRRGNFQ